MTRNILVASREFSHLVPRTAALKAAGFMTIRLRDLKVVSTLAHFDCFRTIVLDHTITSVEQCAIIEKLRSLSSRFHVICLCTDSAPSRAVVRECLACEQEKECGGVHVMDEGPIPVTAECQTALYGKDHSRVHKYLPAMGAL
jgi:hypothetical protein